MSKEKQIEEMAKALTAYEKKLCERLPKDKCLLTSAVHAQVSCDNCKIAEFIVNAGYRKQRVGEWIWTEKGEADCEKYWVCSACKEHDFVKTKYCPNCGAKMKGSA